MATHLVFSTFTCYKTLLSKVSDICGSSRLPSYFYMLVLSFCFCSFWQTVLLPLIVEAQLIWLRITCKSSIEGTARKWKCTEFWEDLSSFEDFQIHMYMVQILLHDGMSFLILITHLLLMPLVNYSDIVLFKFSS